MLVFISDLHFIDETAGEHNIPAKAFKGAFEDICKSCDRPEEVKIVFLGDVFDLLRTTYWLTVPQAERPWGTDMSAVDRHANKIMDDILRINSDTFEIFRDLTMECGVEKIYIPGNHDRLCNLFDSLRGKVRSSLGLPAGTAPFAHFYDDLQYGNKYGVLARHGHEFDQWNYEGTTHYTDSDYAQVPIGDPITTELVAALPDTIMKYVKQMSPPLQPAQLKALERNLQEIDNVRPISAVLHWLFYQVQENQEIRDEIDKAVREIAENFDNLDMVKKWYKRHRTLNPFASDSSDMLQTAIELFKRFNIGSAETLVTLFDKIFGPSDKAEPGKTDEALIKAGQDFLTHTSDYKYVAMGHTHNALEAPIRVTSTGTDQVYFNTGTWRKKYTQGISNGFIGTKYLTYTMFYTEKENGDQCFETWTGSLKEA
jgi:UDP-2,3-diacylglucosamine pyrophosphatase LpxH